MRLIDADSFIVDIETENINLYLDGLKGTPRPREISLTEVIDRIKEQDTVDTEPVKHGHWILEREPDGKPYCFHCSVCDNDFHHIGIMSATDYCPNCGAKMDEVSE